MKKLALLLAVLALGLASAQPATTATAAGNPGPKPVPWLTFDVKDFGKIVVELSPDIAPLNVKNVETLAAKGFYNGLTFHRVIEGFMIQGGDPTGTGMGGPDYTVPAEIKLSNVRGAMAMARTGDEVNPQRASSSCQFYIVHKDAKFLDGAYTVIGMTREGMDVVDRIAAVQRDYADKPLTPVIMQKVTVELREPYREPPPPRFEGQLFLTVDFKGYGKVKVELYPDDAPKNVKSISDFAETGFYDSTTVREIVAGGYIQLGDKRSEVGRCSGGGCGGCGTVPAEFKRKHVRGAVGVGKALNQKKPATACEFYFCLADQPLLDEAGYTVIGQVVGDGMKVLDKIAKAKLDANRKPKTPILISKVTLEHVKPDSKDN
jgi:peptidyl-prolyl cis-trans isomerase B (cyclophilin B)